MLGLRSESIVTHPVLRIQCCSRRRVLKLLSPKGNGEGEDERVSENFVCRVPRVFSEVAFAAEQKRALGQLEAVRSQVNRLSAQ